jgi:hypothetical protein
VKTVREESDILTTYQELVPSPVPHVDAAVKRVEFVLQVSVSTSAIASSTSGNDRMRCWKR